MQKILLLVLVVSLAGCATGNFDQQLATIPQDASVYLQPGTADKALFTDNEQTALKQQYLCHYFSPWTGKCLFTDMDHIKSQETEHITKFTAAPGWAANRHLHTQEWISAITENMDMTTFPNNHIKAITVTDINLRELPTDEPLFKERPGNPDDGYPFDQMQASYLPANTPILIVQTSKDKVWNLVLTPNATGWLRNQDISYVANKFIRNWQRKNYIAILEDRVVIEGTKKDFSFYSRLGAIYPFVNEAEDYYQILVAQPAANHRAVIKTARIMKDSAAIMPLPATPLNIAIVANSQLGKPYGWGGMHGYRDCSATLMDLFTPFAIWLPRNSSQQIQVGKFISLADLSNKEKRLLIRKYSVPFLSLIGLPGHIVLYLGDKDGQQYVYHTVWGTHNVFGQEKSVVGQTVITPLEGGLLDKATGITTINFSNFSYRARILSHYCIGS